MFKRIKELKSGLAVCFLVLMTVIAIALGNHNAMKNERRACDENFQGILAAADERLGEATNLMVLAERYQIDARSELANAIEALEEASTPSEVAEANVFLTDCAQKAEKEIRAVLENGDEKGDMKNLQAVMDDLQSAQNILSRLAEDYNEAARQAQEVYEKLPMGFLLGKAPETFEPGDV